MLWAKDILTDVSVIGCSYRDVQLFNRPGSDFEPDGD
jgi:hypothetical protein